ncbi:hypothetical protein [Alteribacillus sp. HJP-4]|uniref:hypothetical protein n=1 Tax=Alteribacillus sp. HJP-4 TaxID=2775394 RepID=UPI0035CD2870
MLDGKRNKILALVILAAVLVIFLGDEIFGLLALAAAVASFYGGVKLIRTKESGAMHLGGLALIIFGAFILAGWLPFLLTIAAIAVTAYLIWKGWLSKKANIS